MNRHVGGWFLKFIDETWGNLKTPESRKAWLLAQRSKIEAEDREMRKWILEKKVIRKLIDQAFENENKAQRLSFIRENSGWIEYYNLKNEVNKEYKRRANTK